MQTVETTLPPVLAEYKRAYEDEHGEQMNPLVVAICAYFERLHEGMKELGRKDAEEGRRALPKTLFYELLQYVTGKRDDVALEWTEVVYDGYSTAYNNAKKGNVE